MTEHPPTPSEIRGRNRANKKKPKKAPAKCASCEGTGEVRLPQQHATRCQECGGSGIARQSENRQLEAYVHGN